MKHVLVLFALLCSGLVHAALEAGSYIGEDNAKGSYELHIRELPERRGSFLGLLVNKDETKVRAYLIDGFSSSKYGFLSLRLTGNYNIGVSNTLPAMALTVTNDTLVMTSNSGQNDMGFNTSITFRMKNKQQLRWVPLLAGNYNNKSIVVSNLDAEDEATMTSKAPGMTGDYILRETRQNLYVILSTQLTATGVKLNKDATKFSAFLSGSRFSSAKMLVIDSTSGATAPLKNK